MTGVDVAVYVLIGLIGSFCSGMLGVGGAIVTYPLLYFVPPMVGAYSLTPNEISSSTMIQVLAATGIGMLMYRNSPWKSTAVVRVIGGGMLIGSLAGGLLSGRMPGTAIHVMYGCMALAAVFLLLRKQRGSLPACEEDPAQIVFDQKRGALIASGVGLLSGIVGAGGSFLLLPLLIRVLNIPMRTAIASSLTVVFLSSIGGAIGKVAGGHLHYGLTGLLVASSFVGSVVGVRLGQRINVQMLRLLLSLIILISALNIWGELLWMVFE